MKPLISVIVPVWNVEKYLSRCLDSIINQTYKNLEIIVVNDGSTDNSGAVCDEYKNKDARIKVIHKENGGAVSARKEGIAISKGEYIAFVDSDDYIDENMYYHMMGMMIEHGVDLVTVGIIYDFDNHKKTYTKIKSGVYSQDSDSEYSISDKVFTLNDNTPIITSYNCDKLYKRYIVEDYYMKIPNIVFPEDALFLYSALPFVKSIYISNEDYYYYNQMNVNSIAKKLNKDNHYIKDVVDMYDVLTKKYSNHKEKEVLMKQLDTFFLKMLIQILPASVKNRMINYKFPIENIKDKKILLYGAGNVGSSFYRQLKKAELEIVGIVDKSKANTQLENITVKDVSEINSLKYDLIIISVLKEELAKEIKTEIINEFNIKSDKILWEKPILAIDELIK